MLLFSKKKPKPEPEGENKTAEEVKPEEITMDEQTKEQK